MTLGSNTERSNNWTTSNRRKLRPLVITMGGPRQIAIEEMFTSMSQDFEPPAFSPGVPSRSLRNRFEFLRIAHQAGLVSDIEWEALERGGQVEDYQLHPDRFFECLEDVPVTLGRRGSDYDVQLHHSIELWQKSKGLNRGRAVMACLLAHLIAMKRCVEEGYDFILEDNVRTAPDDCARRILEAMDASKAWEQRNEESCHLRYYGWLGSLPNLNWVFSTHMPRTSFSRELAADESPVTSVFTFPVTQDFGLSPEEMESVNEEEENHSPHPPPASVSGHKKPGGTPIWGAYAYWISRCGYDSLLDALRMDVGAMLWKGKRMRTYSVKAIDKVLPRQVMASLGRACVHVSTHPAFFRAPMLTSKIHAKWDAEFCKSTEYQMSHVMLSWSDLWLSDTERRIVHHHSQTGNWLTMDELAELESICEEEQ